MIDNFDDFGDSDDSDDSDDSTVGSLGKNRPKNIFMTILNEYAIK